MPKYSHKSNKCKLSIVVLPLKGKVVLIEWMTALLEYLLQVYIDQ